MGKKVAIVGTGAVGGYVGAHMVQAGEDVTFLDPWPEHVEEMRRRGLMSRDRMHHAVDDQFGHPQKGKRQQRREQAQCQVERDDACPGLPNDAKNDWNITEGREAILPIAPEFSPCKHC